MEQTLFPVEGRLLNIPIDPDVEMLYATLDSTLTVTVCLERTSKIIYIRLYAVAATCFINFKFRDRGPPMHTMY